MALVAEACPDIKKMIFKYNPEYFSSYLQVIDFCFCATHSHNQLFQLTDFCHLRHLETWGGSFQSSGLSHLLEVIGERLELLHLCHVEDLCLDDMISITKHCRLELIHVLSSTLSSYFRHLKSFTLENCSFNIEDSELDEETLCLKNLKVPLLLDLKMFKVINVPVEMAFLILRKSLNIENIEIDGEMDLRDWNILELMKENTFNKLKDLLIYSSRYLLVFINVNVLIPLLFRNLTLNSLYHILETCPNLCSVRYLSNWKAVTRSELIQFWKDMRENNVNIDFGEQEWKEVSSGFLY